MSRVPKPGTGHGPSSSAAAPYIGARIRDAMERLGWVDDDGKPHVTTLAEQVGKSMGRDPIRWQTAQKWVNGETAPRGAHAPHLARVLGMTLDELLGVAAGQDPPFASWREFLATDLGQSMTPDERRTLQALPWPIGREPTVAAYASMLSGVRLTVPRTS